MFWKSSAIIRSNWRQTLALGYMKFKIDSILSIIIDLKSFTIDYCVSFL